MFDKYEFLLQHLRHALKLKLNLLSINMFDGLGFYIRTDMSWWMFDGLRFYIRIKHRMMKIYHGELIIAKGSKMYGLNILDGLTIIASALLANRNWHVKTKIWPLRLESISEMNLVELAKHDLLSSDKLGKI